jgi:hypothetical protein
MRRANGLPRYSWDSAPPCGGPRPAGRARSARDVDRDFPDDARDLRIGSYSGRPESSLDKPPPTRSRGAAWERPMRPILPPWGSDSNGAFFNDLPIGSFSRTTVIENPQRFWVRPCDSAGSRFSITALECVFSNQPLGDGFREGKAPSNRVIRPSSLFFAPLLSDPQVVRGWPLTRG